MATTNHSLPSESDFARLEGELFTRIDRRHRGQIVLHRLIVSAAVLVLAGAGVAAGTTASPTQQTTVAYCHAKASASSEVASTALSLDALAKQNGSLRPSSAKIARAVAQCGGVWRAGVFTTVSTKSVPKLQPCLRDDLVISVFPRKHLGGNPEAFCEQFGMSAP
jgi:hypothetical protein